ncbi:MAG: DNA mismatch repair endonuclease MutL [Thermodesulfovibrionales bacterium]|nr:DNA mismatch repair endonuclease MutL [Thermodesulfovibrionales bacterium]
MPKINILSESLQNKIAAGEVIERPASVVKELIENSIDAGSSKIIIKTLSAGKKLIKVIDNGCGMDKEDALIAFQRFATSKISSEDDLFNLKTFGFRGEALSSISSVSKIKLITGSKEQSDYIGQNNLGTVVEIQGGEIKNISISPASGTTIEVRDLFFNTPARKKFLKSDQTENHHIIDIVTKEAIANFNISFELTMNEEDILILPNAFSEAERISQIFGKNFLDDLLEISGECDLAKIKAFISKNSNFRTNRSHQYIFVNKRYVKDQLISYAVYQSYEGSLTKDKHPIFFIFLEIDPKEVDFNVHPTKREVRFRNKNFIYDFVMSTIKQGLISTSSLRVSDEPISTPTQVFKEDTMPYGISSSISESIPFTYISIPKTIHIGDTFLAMPTEKGLTIIDYHAVHERVIYDKLLKSDIRSVSLLFSQHVLLDPAKYKAITENLQLINKFGFEIEDFGNCSILVRAVPDFVDNYNLDILINELASSIINSREFKEVVDLESLDSIRKKIASTVACHNSIRGKEIPDNLKVAELMNSLAKTDNPDRCPHGRPTKIELSIDELRKFFKK